MPTNFYLQLEPAIRPVVWALRENGINTTCSCGHEMYVECESWDPTNEFNTIYNVLYEMGYREFTIELKWEVHKMGDIFRGLIIKMLNRPKAAGSPKPTQPAGVSHRG